MRQTRKLSSQELLKKNVLDAGLCTGCGACVNLCPYQVIYRDRTVQLHSCDLSDGKCYAFCPRSSTDLSVLRKSLFPQADVTPEIGVVKGYYLSRAADSNLRERAQHGGTITALMELALAEGLIETAIVSSSERQVNVPVAIKSKDDLLQNSQSRFTVSPTVATFHEIAAENIAKIGVVATPCQALALAKIKTYTDKDASLKKDKLKLVVGLFCGWTLARDKFTELLKMNNIDESAVVGMEIPAGKGILEIYTPQGNRTIPMKEVENCIREACRYCVDSTAEYADVSVGAARFGNDWEEMRKWNQLIVRTEAGSDLIDLAVARGVLEIKEAPSEILKELKKAALEKKKVAMKNIVAKSGRENNLLYLNSNDSLIKGLLKRSGRKK